jgi:hypothetical protein
MTTEQINTSLVNLLDNKTGLIKAINETRDGKYTGPNFTKFGDSIIELADAIKDVRGAK